MTRLGCGGGLGGWDSAGSGLCGVCCWSGVSSLFINISRRCSSCFRVSEFSGGRSLSSLMDRSAWVKTLAAATINPSRFAIGIRKLWGSHLRVSTTLVRPVCLDHTL